MWKENVLKGQLKAKEKRERLLLQRLRRCKTSQEALARGWRWQGGTPVHPKVAQGLWERVSRLDSEIEAFWTGTGNHTVSCAGEGASKKRRRCHLLQRLRRYRTSKKLYNEAGVVMEAPTLFATNDPARREGGMNRSIARPRFAVESESATWVLKQKLCIEPGEMADALTSIARSDSAERSCTI